MTIEQHRQRTRERLHVDLWDSPFLDSAILWVLERGSLPDDARYRLAAKRLRELHQTWIVTRGVGRLTPTDMLFGEALVRALAPKMEALRLDGFGSASPPFSTVAEVSVWVEEAGETARADAQNRSEERERAWKEIERLAAESGLEVEFKSTHLAYQREGDAHIRHVHTIPGSFPWRLARETQNMAKDTGLAADALVTHVLTGLIPVRPRAQLKSALKIHNLPGGEHIAANRANVTFLAPDLKEREIRNIYNSIRSHMGSKRTRSLSFKDVEVWRIAQDQGGPPRQHGSKGAFWRAVLDAWNRRHPDERYTSANWAKKRYQRAVQKLQGEVGPLT